MDSEAFDRFISALGRTGSRRGVVQVVATTVGLGGLSLLGLQDTAARKRKRRCTGGTLKCAVGCIDPQTDFNNCGTCGNVCGQGQTCTAGTCTGGGGSPPPPPVQSCTGQPDLTNCGGGKQCSGGVCTTPLTCGVAPDRCASALDCCGNACDPAVGTCPLSDPGNPCRTAASCSGGAKCVGFVCQ